MIFVFGSNLAGRHGAGAALYAARKYGAKYGVGVGRTGDAYALPTKDENLKTLPLSEIEHHIRDFIDHARKNHDTLFQLTPIGCGLAGYKKSEIWAILKRVGLPANIYLSSSWVNDE